MFISEKTMFDVASMVIGFKSYCSILFSQYPGCEIKPSRTNQDRQELFFGRQRAQEGQNENPTELSYGVYMYMTFLNKSRILSKWQSQCVVR